MDRLWAPWRIKYIQKKKATGCIFCRAAKSKLDKKNYVVLRSRLSFAMLNLFPYNNGHIMISPYKHTKDISKLTQEEILDLFELIKKAKTLLDKVIRPEGYNMGVNIGEVSGAGIAGHLHIHLVPRWKADTNFMPVIFETKIVSQSLDELYGRLKKHARRERD